jgi:hypothetical protein
LSIPSSINIVTIKALLGARKMGNDNSLYEMCRSNLEKLAVSYAEHSGGRNEATTRLQLIDSLVFDCLNWSRDDVIAEEAYEGQYTDYTFLAPRRILILEAKKEGLYFELPAGNKNIEYLIKSIMRDNLGIKNAIEQVARYCQERGVTVAVVCNGHQIIAFIATRNDGVAPLDGKALVFSSLDEMLEHFLDLWQALSKPGVEEKKLVKRLLGDQGFQLPSKLSASIAGYPGIQSRNVFQANLQIVSDFILEDVVRSSDIEATFLKECYCTSGALSQYSLVSKVVLTARYSALFNEDSPGPTTLPAVDKKGISPEIFAESLSRRPVLIIGDVGVGKTTFIRYLRNVEAAEIFKNAISLYIDLGSQATLTNDLNSFIMDEIKTQLMRDYETYIDDKDFVRQVYRGDLDRFGRTVIGGYRETNPNLYQQKEMEFLLNKVENKGEHLQKSIEHIVKGHRKQIVIFFDNADQRLFDTQQATFLISQEIAEHWPVTVFVTLRPETFHRSLKLGALSGYHPKAFTISPPRVDQVLQKRLKFALKITSGEIPLNTYHDVHLKLESLNAIIKSFLYSIENKAELLELIENICGGNVRVALDLVRNFFGSGHVNTQKVFDIFQETGRYNIPLHEFLRAVMYGDSRYYDPTRSLIANIFDVAYADPKEHFLLPVILSLLNTTISVGTNKGFVETYRIYEHAQGLGFTAEQVDMALIRASKHKLIEAVARKELDIEHPLPNAFRATSVGAYHVERLCKFFAYIDATVIDTPIFDNYFNSEIYDVEVFEDRAKRAELFQRYLDEQWQKLSAKNTYFNWSSVSASITSDIRRARESQAYRS